MLAYVSYSICKRLRQGDTLGVMCFSGVLDYYLLFWLDKANLPVLRACIEKASYVSICASINDKMKVTRRVPPEKWFTEAWTPQAVMGSPLNLSTFRVDQSLKLLVLVPCYRRLS
jgi:hypothetical protein